MTDAKATEISRNHKERKAVDSESLYSYISIEVQTAQTGTTKEVKKSLENLLLLFKPLIFRCAQKRYARIRSYIEIEDFLQESYCLFISLVYAYDPEISKFSYFIKTMLPKYIDLWVNKIIKANVPIVSYSDMNTLDTKHYSLDNLFSVILTNIYERHYFEFITTVSSKNTKTTTNKIVCNEYFLGHKSCMQISKELQISYHAVYDYITKIKKELNYYMQTTNEFDFYFDSENNIKFKNKGNA